MTKELKIAGLALALSMPLTAYAALMDTLDSNGDGAVTMEEFQSAMPDAEAGTFSAVDTNADGVLDEAEINAAKEVGTLPEEG